MSHAKKTLQVAFTYIGTIVGAGFASGQEIIQFFTKYGRWGFITILIATALLIWLGSKMMQISLRIRAVSYEDLNIYLFGDRIGKVISLFTLIVLFGIASVMLAGAGSIFEEAFGLSFQLGLMITFLLTYFVLTGGLQSIMQVNTIVVPLMFLFIFLVIVFTLGGDQFDRFLYLQTNESMFRAWTAPILYAAFNLGTAQAVLVPLANEVNNEQIIKWGGWLGGLGIGCMLLASHIALAAKMPYILTFEIPMGQILAEWGPVIQLFFMCIIFLEIFTTLIANVYGLTLQLEQRLQMKQRAILITILLFCYVISQFGFKTLLSYLYPLFGLIGLFWLVMIIQTRTGSRRIPPTS